MFGIPIAALSVVGLVVLLVLLGLLVASRYKVAGPNEAYIVTGRRGKEVRNLETGQVSTDLSGQKVVMGGGVFVLPFVQKLSALDLSSKRGRVPAFRAAEDINLAVYPGEILGLAGDSLAGMVDTEEQGLI